MKLFWNRHSQEGTPQLKYFVTGATGFIGGRLINALLARGHEVVALVRSPARAQHLAQKGASLAEGDIVDKESMRGPMTGVDGVFHVAGWYKVGEKSDAAYKVNVEGTRNVLELMRELAIPKGVYTSSLVVFGDTQGQFPTEDHRFNPDQGFASAYDETKWRAHHEVALPLIEMGLPLVIVQPGVVYGEGDTSSVADGLRDFLRKKLPVLPADAAYMWAHVDDIVEGHLLAMEKGTTGASYIISGEYMKVKDFFKLAEEISGIPAPRMIVPSWVFKTMAALMSLVNNFMTVQGQYHPESLRILSATYLGDNSKAKQEWGYNPRPLREGLPATLHALMDELGIKRQ